MDELTQNSKRPRQISRMITNGADFVCFPMRRRLEKGIFGGRVTEFQKPYQQFVHWSVTARETLRAKIEILYRDCQRFASEEIGKLVAEVNLEFVRERTKKCFTPLAYELSPHSEALNKCTHFPF